MNDATASLWFDPAPDGLRYVVLMNQLDLAAMNAVELVVLEQAARLGNASARCGSAFAHRSRGQPPAGEVYV
jgi:hypothetical protein